MELYLLRHGIADNDSPTGKDADRPLTEEGRRKLRDTIKTVAAAGVKLAPCESLCKGEGVGRDREGDSRIQRRLAAVKCTHP